MSRETITDVAAMKAGFPAKPPSIEGRPTLKTLLKVMVHMRACGMSHRTPGKPLGKLYLVLLANQYALYTASPYPTRAGNPGAVPFYAPNSNPTQRKQVEDNFNVNFKLHHDENNMDMALIERFYSMLDPSYEEELRDATASQANPTFLQIFGYAVQRYGNTTPQSRLENKNSMLHAWHQDDGMEAL